MAGPSLISAATAASDRRFALGVWSSYMPTGAGLSPGWLALLACTMLLANVPGNLIGGALVQRGMSRGRLIAAPTA